MSWVGHGKLREVGLEKNEAATTEKSVCGCPWAGEVLSKKLVLRVRTCTIIGRKPAMQICTRKETDSHKEERIDIEKKVRPRKSR